MEKMTAGDLPAHEENLWHEDAEGRLEATPTGAAFLEGIVTDAEADVYAFHSSFDPTLTAAAMARLSRSPNSPRMTILKEFLSVAGSDIEPVKWEDFLRRVVSAYGDDSVAQLAGQYFMVENASNLMTKKLEWGRLASYLEQSTRYIEFDRKRADGQYGYLVPPEIERLPDLEETYRLGMDAIFDNYSSVVKQLGAYLRERHAKSPDQAEAAGLNNAIRAQACDAARPLLPVALKSSVGVFASAQAVEGLVMRLAAERLAEPQVIGQAILTACRQNIGAFLERADMPERGGATSAYYAENYKILGALVPDSFREVAGVTPAAAELVEYTCADELDLVPDMLYEQTGKSLRELQALIGSWSMTEKQAVFDAYIGERLNRRQKPGRALEKIHYGWDIVCDYGIFRDLQRHRMVDDLTWQLLTPYLGYALPQLVAEVGLEQVYRETFEISGELYENLLPVVGAEVAQYATLLGHNMRWKITYNAREAFHLHELRTAPQGHPGYRRLVNEMHEQVAAVHPRLATAMIFVNKDEDPELTRLAAEKAHQHKLRRLGGA